MTGQQFNELCQSLYKTHIKASEALGISKKTMYNLTQSDQVDKRTELAILYLKQQQEIESNG